MMVAVAKRILIVDDEPYILKILAYKLRREGYTAFEAESAEEAWGILRRNRIDLVLLDVTLATPTTGFDLAARLREEEATRDLPVVMLTARTLADDIRRGHEVGAMGYITKPFSPAEVLETVRSLLGD